MYDRTSLVYLLCVSILETVLIYVLIPLVFVLFVGFLSYLGKPVAGTRPAHYDLTREWKHAPMLWSATDEVTTYGKHGGHAAIESGVDLIGGRASGKF